MEAQNGSLQAKNKWFVLTLLIGTFCTVLSQTLLNTALSTLMKYFAVSTVVIQWLTNGFTLVVGIMIPISAWLMTKFNSKHLYITALSIFFLGTVICSSAFDFPSLLVGRIVEAIGVGIAIPTFQTMIFLIFPPEKRGSAMGLAGIVIGLAPAIGPTLAGWMLLHFEWRMLFVMLLPISLLVIILSFFTVRKVMPTRNEKVDWLSIIESTLGFGGLLYGFSIAGKTTWLAMPVVISLILGIIFIILFIKRQWHLEQPLLNLRVFKSSKYTLSVILATLAFVSMITTAIILPLYLQNVLSQSAFVSGIVLFPGAILMGIFSPVTGKVFDKFGAQGLMKGGFFLQIIGSLPFIFLTNSTSLVYLTIFQGVRMLGITMVIMPITTYGMNALPNSEVKHGTAITNAIRQIFGALISALMITILSNVVSSEMAAKGGSNQGANMQLIQQGALVHGYCAAFLVLVVLGIIGFILSYRVENPRKG